MNKTHPVWSILRLVILLVSMITILYINASSFDANEIFAIIVVMVGACGAEGVSSAIAKDKHHPMWSSLRLFLVMLCLVVTLFLTANNFDKTEISSIVALFLTASGTEGMSTLVSKFIKKPASS